MISFRSMCALGCLAGLTTAGPVFAADLPMRAAPPLVAPPVTSWTGLYVGLNAGYVELDRGATVGTPIFGNAGFNGGPTANLGNATAVTGPIPSSSGFLGGGQLGYNLQVGAFVLGAEADIQGMIRAETYGRSINVPLLGFPTNPIVGTTLSTQSFDYFGTVRGRVGYTFGDLLVYGTGGFAYGEKTRDVQFSLQVQPGAGSFVTMPYGVSLRTSSLRTGYTAGGGVEYRLSEAWSVKAEALYYDLGRSSAATQFSSFTAFTTPPTLFTTNGIRATSNDRGYIARAGINYRFNLF